MKNNDKPFIKKFKIDDNCYIYDVNSNKFFRVDEPVYILIDNKKGGDFYGKKILRKYPKHLIKKAEENINLMKKKGYFSSHRPQITYFHTISKDNFMVFLKDILNNKLQRITLVVTEKCNLRCTYCAYSGKYQFHRKHSKKNMNVEMMKKAVDFYFSKSSANNEKNISLYGGEPLLNFGLIKECVNYIKKTYSTIAKFNMTTNGTLLNKKNIKFLVQNQFSLLISIDGPKEIHDRYRVFKNGKGTFNCIIKNLRTMKSMYPEYYNNKVRFNMVLAPPLDFDKLNEFICEIDVKPSSIKFSRVNTHFTNFFNQFSQEQMIDFKKSKIKTMDSFNRKLVESKELNEVEKNMFRQRFLFIHRRDMEKLSSKVPSNGQCMIGERSLLINTNGNFNFCTRIDDVFNLGNIYTGYDYKRIEKIYFDLEEFLGKRCYGCWAIRLCMKCINDINKNGELDEDVFDLFCNKKKKSLLNEIKDYIRIRENNYDALDYLKDITIS